MAITSEYIQEMRSAKQRMETICCFALRVSCIAYCSGRY